MSNLPEVYYTAAELTQPTGDGMTWCVHRRWRSRAQSCWTIEALCRTGDIARRMVGALESTDERDALQKQIEGYKDAMSLHELVPLAKRIAKTRRIPTLAVTFDDVARQLVDEYVRLQAENETLRAAIATPEVYAGIITKTLEAERDAAVAELKAVQIQCRRES